MFLCSDFAWCVQDVNTVHSSVETPMDLRKSFSICTQEPHQTNAAGQLLLPSQIWWWWAFSGILGIDSMPLLTTCKDAEQPQVLGVFFRMFSWRCSVQSMHCAHRQCAPARALHRRLPRQ